MKKIESSCEGSGIKNVVVGSEFAEDFCDCALGDLLCREAEGADFEDDLPVPHPVSAYRVLNWFNA